MNRILPRVAICFPSSDMVHADFALALAGLCNSTQPIETPLVNNKSSIVAMARNDGVKCAQDMNADFLLFLDSDMTFPRSTLHRLLAHRKDIVGATYTKRVPPFTLLGAVFDRNETIDEHGLIRMRHMPTGCLLIRMTVFEKLSAPHFRFLTNETTGEIHGEDYVFCDRAHEAGFEVWCDAALSLELGHIGQRIFRFSADDDTPAQFEVVPETTRRALAA
jgi:hypothetical protein